MGTLASSTSTATTASIHHPQLLTKSSLPFNDRLFNCMISQNGFSFFCPMNLSLRCQQSRRSSSMIIQAVKKNKNDDDEEKKKKRRDKKKVDSHSAVPKPDEATGPFPESVLLKKRTVEEDGKRLPEFADAEEREMFEYLTLQLESELNVDRMRHYEVVYLIHEDRKDEVGNVNAKVEEFLQEKKGKIWRFNDWGLRRLAYKIKKAKYAHYILMNFEVEAKWINDFKRMLDLDERVIRHLVIKRDKAITEFCEPPPEYHTLVGGMDAEDVEDDDEYDEKEDDDWDEYDEEEDEDLEENYIDDDGVIYVNGREDDIDKETDSCKTSIKKNNNVKRTQKLRK